MLKDNLKKKTNKLFFVAHIGLEQKKDYKSHFNLNPSISEP